MFDIICRVGYYAALGVHQLTNHPADLVREIIFVENHHLYTTLEHDIAVVCWKDPVEYSDEVYVRMKCYFD